MQTKSSAPSVTTCGIPNSARCLQPFRRRWTDSADELVRKLRRRHVEHGGDRTGRDQLLHRAAADPVLVEDDDLVAELLQPAPRCVDAGHRDREHRRADERLRRRRACGGRDLAMPAIAAAAFERMGAEMRLIPAMSVTAYIIVRSVPPTYGRMSRGATAETTSFGVPTGNARIAAVATLEPPVPPMPSDARPAGPRRAGGSAISRGPAAHRFERRRSIARRRELLDVFASRLGHLAPGHVRLDAAARPAPRRRRGRPRRRARAGGRAETRTRRPWYRAFRPERRLRGACSCLLRPNRSVSVKTPEMPVKNGWTIRRALLSAASSCRRPVRLRHRTQGVAGVVIPLARLWAWSGLRHTQGPPGTTSPSRSGGWRGSPSPRACLDARSAHERGPRSPLSFYDVPPALLSCSLHFPIGGC